MKTFRFTGAYRKDLKRVTRGNYDLTLRSQIPSILCARASSSQQRGATTPSKANGKAGASAISSLIGC